MTEEDLRFYNEVRNDVCKWLHDPATYSYEQCCNWFKTYKDKTFIYSIDGNRVGYFRTSNWGVDNCYVGLDLHDKYRGKGLAVNAYHDFFNFLQREYGIYRYRLEVLEKNIRAFNLYKKLGFKIIEKQNGNIKMELNLSTQDDINTIQKSIDSKRFEGKKVLLIGSNGFLGRWFYDYFKSIETDILCIDNDIAPTDSKAEYLNHNICDSLDIDDRFDFIINCAGIASPEKYLQLPVETLDVSYIGTRNIFEFARKTNPESIMCFSSSEIYGTPDPDAIPTKESYIGSIPTMGNRSCYDVGKLVLETLSHIYYNKHNLNIKIVRPFNLYGPYMGVKDNRVLSNFMNNFIDKKPVKIYGDGLQTRTFCYVADGIAMMLGVLLDGKNGDVYNVGNPVPEINMNELADMFYHALGENFKYEQIPYPDDYPSDEPTRRSPNIDKVVKEIGIQPQVGLEVGIRKMYEYFKNIKVKHK